MLRGFTLEEVRCYDHPHRVVETRCARCGTPYCPACLVQVPPENQPPPPRRWPWHRDVPEPVPPDAGYCQPCADELQRQAEADRAAKRPLWQRRPTRGTAVLWLTVTAILVVILVPAYWVAGYITQDALTSEEVARISVGLRGGFRSLEGVNILSVVYTAKFLHTNAASQPEHGPELLIDTYWQSNVPGWRSAGAQFPIDLAFQAANRASMGKLILRVRPGTPPESWPREFELLVSDEGPDTGYQVVLQATFSREEAERLLRDTTRRPEALVPAPLRYTFPETMGSFVMLRILSNYGQPDFTSLAEVEVYPAERTPY